MGQVSVLDTLCVVRVPTCLPNTQILNFPGTVVAAHNKNDEILNMRVFLVPTRGWEKDPLAPEAPQGPPSSRTTILLHA